jgi:hypothetical protein
MIDLEALRRSYAEQITQLQRKLQFVDELVEDGKRLGQDAPVAAPSAQPDTIGNSVETEDLKYTRMSLTPAIRDALKYVPSNGRGFTGADLRKYLLRNGFQTRSKHFTSAVNKALDRLARQQALIMSKDDNMGVRIYRTNHPNS